MAAKMYYDDDADLGLLQGKTIGVVGFGSQGHAQALNLRDSGLKVIVNTREGSANWKLALEKGFAPEADPAAVAEQADFIMLPVPDQHHAAIFNERLKPHLTAGKTLAVSHGFSLHFGQIEPPEDVDVVMIAPKGPGHLVRAEYEKGAGVPCLLAVEQDASGQAKQTALAYAKGIGGTRGGVQDRRSQSGCWSRRRLQRSRRPRQSRRPPPTGSGHRPRDREPLGRGARPCQPGVAED